MSSNTNTDTSQQQQARSALSSAAGVAAGHAEYARGVAEETIASVTGSKDWQNAGQDIKRDATQNIRDAANSGPDLQGQGGVGGKAAELADKACPQTGQGVGK